MSRLPDEHVNRKDNALNIEHLISEKRSGLDYGVVRISVSTHLLFKCRGESQKDRQRQAGHEQTCQGESSVS